jgi:hypothetical protein
MLLEGKCFTTELLRFKEKFGVDAQLRELEVYLGKWLTVSEPGGCRGFCCAEAAKMQERVCE